MTLQREGQAVERVEWLAALWELGGNGRSSTANPHLLTLLRFAPKIARHPAFEQVKRLSRLHSRDALIKDVVGAVYGAPAEHPELSAALQSLVAQAQGLVGRGFCYVIQHARAEALEKARQIAGELNPAADLERATGERVALRVVLAPSVFLPPPQEGRHGTLVRDSAGWVAYLAFGLPLRRDPRRYSVRRPWLQGGAWHYAIDLYLQQHWPPIARQLAADDELAAAVSRALGPGWQARGRPWTDHLKLHVNVALKCLLSRQLGVPDVVHQAFARVSGLRLFPWFKEWLLDSGAEGAALTAHLATLPVAFVAARSRWEDLARTASSSPTAINLALISASAKRASLVVPDDWSDEVASAAVAGWRLLRTPLLRYSEWLGRPVSESGPVVAFGEPGNNPLVDRVLAERGLSFETLETSAPTIVAISMPVTDEESWCIAVAGSPESAARLRIETALAQTSSYFAADGVAVLDCDQAVLE